LVKDSAHGAHNIALFNSWLNTHCELAVKAAKHLQPIWSLPTAKVAQFPEAYASAVGRMRSIVGQLGLTLPACVAD
jgi:propane monooxygenase small subunit